MTSDNVNGDKIDELWMDYWKSGEPENLLSFFPSNIPNALVGCGQITFNTSHSFLSALTA